MRFLTLSGVKESGKTTAFEIIKSIRGDVVEIQLAKKLKDVCSKYLSIPRYYFDDQNYKEVPLPVPAVLNRENLSAILAEFDFTYTEKHDQYVGKILPSPRVAAQFVGTEILRNENPDIHCLHALKGFQEGLGIITDARFCNELDFFERYDNFIGGFFIYRTEMVEKLKREMAQGTAHASESSILDLLPRTQIIYNDGSIEDLKRAVQAKINLI